MLATISSFSFISMLKVSIRGGWETTVRKGFIRDWVRSGFPFYLKSDRIGTIACFLFISLDLILLRWRSFDLIEYLWEAFEFDLLFLVEASSFSLLSTIIFEFLESISNLCISPCTCYTGFVILLYKSWLSVILLGSIISSLFDLQDILLTSSDCILIRSRNSVGGSSI